MLIDWQFLTCFILRLTRLTRVEGVQSCSEKNSSVYVYVYVYVCVWGGCPHPQEAILRIPACVLQFKSTPILSTWTFHKLSPSPLQMPFVTCVSDPLGYRLEGPTNVSSGSINLLEWLTELRETFYVLDDWFIRKSYNSGTPR